MNRETWLENASALIAEWATERGVDLPKVPVSVGFPLGRARPSAKGGAHTIGQCHYTATDGVPQVYISPVLHEGPRVLDVLAHELIHAALPDAGHRAPFTRAARALDLQGKPSATVAGDEFKEQAAGWMTTLGDYPHAAIDLTAIKKQTTRMLKVECPCCGYTVRTTQKWLDMGTPACPFSTRMRVV